MKIKIFTILIILLFLCSSINALSSKAECYNLDDQTIENTYEPMELTKTIWNGNQWVDKINTDVDETIRFKITIIYHDTDGEGIGFILTEISIIDNLPIGLNYSYNASRPQDYVSSDGRSVLWNLTEVKLFDNQSYSLEFDVKTTGAGTHINLANVSAIEHCMGEPRWGEARATVVVEQYYDLTIDVDGNGTTDPTPGIHSYLMGTEVELNAFAGEDWDFMNWSGSISGSDNPVTILLDSDKAVTAHFIEKNSDPPTVEITKPKDNKFYFFNIPKPIIDGIKIKGPITIKAEAESDNGIDHVEFYLDGKLKHTDNSAPYSWLWLLKPLDLKIDYTIKAVAYDNLGNSGSDEINVQRKRFTPLLSHPIISFLGIGSIYLKKTIRFVEPDEVRPIENRPPVAIINGSYTGFVDIPLTFDGSESYDRNNDTLSYKWDFGDGTTGTGEQSTHTYRKEGVYTLSLTVTDSKGLTDTVSTTATILSKDKAKTTNGAQELNMLLYIAIGAIIIFIIVFYLRKKR